MKTLNTLTAAILFFLSVSAFASNDAKDAKLTMDYTIQTFIDAMAHGKTKSLPKVLDGDIKLTTAIKDKIINYNRSEILQSLKNIENIEQNCNASYSIIDQDSSMAAVKVTLKFPGFTKTSFLNMANTTSGWKITSISETYK